MPKKTRKMKQRAAMRRGVPETTQDSNSESDAAQVFAATPTARAILPTAGRVVTPATYDYSHIYSDLKRIAIFATFFFAVLIALSFVIK